VPLEDYWKKRDFNKTPEPPARVRAPRSRRKPIFVVQKHDATRLHYDFRIEICGVLVSWAVPKGPSMNPAEKRLAVRTEDHPLEYAEFEGVIPEGQYGAGTVMLWDRGNYQSRQEDPMDRQLARGTIGMLLYGERLRGQFALVRTRLPASGRNRNEQWLLIKRRDECAAPAWNIESPRLQRSVLSGRTLDEIASGKSRRNASAWRKRV
jgi:bifunctional non-homologous end joining protein LigD